MILWKAYLMAALMLGTAAVALPATTPAQSSAAKSTATQTTATTKSATEVATHHEMGTVSSVSDSELVLSHENKGKAVRTTFTLNSSTKRDGTINKGERVEVSYHNLNKEHVATEVKPEPKRS